MRSRRAITTLEAFIEFYRLFKSMFRLYAGYLDFDRENGCRHTRHHRTGVPLNLQWLEIAILFKANSLHTNKISYVI